MNQTSSSFSCTQDGVAQSVDYFSNPKATTTINPSTPAINTKVAMTITPASAAVSATTISSTASSSRTQLHALKTQPGSFQDQDTGISPQSYPSPSPSTTAYTFEYSQSPYHRPSMPGAMSDVMSSSKSPSLMRRLSRGAHQKLRRKASQQHTLRMRDQSAGPVLVRRRSDSNGASDLARDMSDLELENGSDNNLDDPPYPSGLRGRNKGLGIDLNRPANAANAFPGGIAPAVSAILQNGTFVTKYAAKNKKNKRIKLWLDPSSARVCWHSTNLLKSFFIDDVREVRIGAESRNARDDAQLLDIEEGRFMTIVYDPPGRSKGRNTKTMYLIFDSAIVVKYWNEVLDTVARHRVEVMNVLSSSVEKSERSMALVWKLAMNKKHEDAPPLFTLDDARWLCRKLEINCSDSAVRTHFTRSDTSGSGGLNYIQYQDFVNSFKERKDIQNLYRNINFGTDLDMGLESFLTFLKNDQSIEVENDLAHWEGVFEKFAKPAQNRPALPDAQPDVKPLALNMQGFQNFLLSSYNSPLASSKGQPLLNQPLNEYFISSSHNTYLMGRQVGGESSVEGYIAALIKGCRCVEIDCWDGDGGRPMVTHGRTMTTKIPFEDCVSTIAKYAFHNSPYPLIVSLEVHCSREQQKTMVDMMVKYWKNTLVTEPLAANASTLPSPEALRGKILVKVKMAEDGEPAQASIDPPNGRSRARSLGSAFVRTSSVDKAGFPFTHAMASPAATSPSETTIESVSTPRDSITSAPTVTPNSSADDSDENLLSPEKPRKRNTSKIIPELGRLGVYAQGIKYPGFDEPESKVTNHIFSFNENTFNRLSTKLADTKVLLENHNVRYLMRVYPRPGRIDSSNFNPLEVWRRGVQMAALNWQTYDVHQQVNEAMFAAGSDRVGYVLKPEQLRHLKQLPVLDGLLDTTEKNFKKDKKFVKFSVDVISAQRLPKPYDTSRDNGMNPYIEFEMYCADDKTHGIARGEGGTDASAQYGFSGIGSPLRKRTKIIEGNGFDPIYNQPLTLTLMTKYPSLIFVRFTVWNSPEARPNSANNVLLATFTAKLSSLQQGYHHLPLFNPQGEQYRDAKLFVKIKKEDPIPLHLDDNAYNMMEPATSPRTDPIRTERNWRRVFSRNSSQRRMAQQSEDVAGLLSRTSSMDRESLR